MRRKFGTNISTQPARAFSHLHYELFDHAILRRFWTNFAEIAPGVFRSNQPGFRRFKAYQARGIRSVINLRGPDKYAHYLFEREHCEALGLKLHDAKLWARAAATRERILAVIDTMRAVERPFVMHCKSGADRAGFASAIYLMVFEDVPPQEAIKQLSFRHLHIRASKTGVLDYILEVYASRNAQAPVGFEEWVREEYDQKAIQADFDARVPVDHRRYALSRVSGEAPQA